MLDLIQPYLDYFTANPEWALVIVFLIALGEALLRFRIAGIAALGGGISNDVWRVAWDGGCVVVKQALPLLRVEEEWAYTVERSSVESPRAKAAWTVRIL